MFITKPAYFDRFHCIAGACPDSCCKEWDVQVDEISAAYYRTLSGQLGENLRKVLRTENGESLMTAAEGRCPMWQADGLCRIQAELGENALCAVCREFPRLTHDYGDFIERGLELSCPEAAKIILTADAAPRLTEEISGGAEPEYDPHAMAVLKATREDVLAILDDPILSAGEILTLVLFFGYQAQAILDGEDTPTFSTESILSEAKNFAQTGNIEDFLNFFLGLNILTPRWKERLSRPEGTGIGRECLPLARYLTERYWLQAVSDYDLVCRVKFILIACILISCLGGDFIATAQLWSKEIENDADNVDALLDGAYTHPAFTDARLLGFLLR